MREYMRKRYHDRMNAAKEFLGGECVKCESNEKLDLDHIDPSDKSFTIASLHNCSIDKFWLEVKKCQLLCRDCHVAKTRKDFGYHDSKELVKLTCKNCGINFERTMHKVGYKLDRGQKNFYCSKECASVTQFKTKLP